MFAVEANGSVTDLNDGLEITEFTRGASTFNGGQDIVAGTQDNGTLGRRTCWPRRLRIAGTRCCRATAGYGSEPGARGEFYLEYVAAKSTTRSPPRKLPSI